MCGGATIVAVCYWRQCTVFVSVVSVCDIFRGLSSPEIPEITKLML